MINIKIKKKFEEPTEADSLQLGPEDREIAGYLAEKAFDYLCEAYDTNGKSEIFDRYVETMMGAAREQKYYAMGMVCAMLKDNDCPELSHIIEQLVLKEEETIAVFVNHFIALAIDCMFFDDDEEDDADTCLCEECEMCEECGFHG